MLRVTILTPTIAAAVVVAGCSRPVDPVVVGAANPPAGAEKTHGHPHDRGPNGGVVFELGKYHAELTVDHDAKQCQVLVLSPDETNPTPTAVAAAELTLTTTATTTKDGTAVPPVTVTLRPRGGSGL